MRNYRIVRTAPINYTRAIQKLYDRDPTLCRLEYSQQQRRIFEQCCVYSDGFSRAMNGLGNEAHEILFDFEPLQKAWARDNGFSYSQDNWQFDIAAGQLRAIRPDVVYFQGSSKIFFELGPYIKQQLGFIKGVFLCSGFPGKHSDLSWLDGAFVAAPYLLEPYVKQGIEAHVSYHAFDERILSKVGVANDRDHEFTFVGSSGFGVHRGHNERFWMLVKLMKETPLQVWVEEQLGQRELTRRLLKEAGCRDDIDKVSTYMLGLTFRPKTVEELVSIWPQFMAHLQDAVEKKIPRQEGFGIMPLEELFPDRCHKPVFGLDMYRVLQSSQLTFNKHTTVGGGEVGTMRLFEACGIGTCMISDDGKNMGDIFERDSEIVVYNCFEECVEKVKYLLGHDELRRQIAAAGQQRVLREHTVARRCRHIDGYIQKILSRQGCLA